MKTPDAILGVMLKGVDGGYDWSFFRDHLLEGELPRVGDSIRTKEILISRSVAREMGLVPGDKVEMLFVESEKSPRRDRFKVSGIYATGMDEFDRSVAMTDLRNVRRLADWSSDEVSGYEVTLADFSQAEDFSRRLNDMLLDSDREAFWDLTARSAQERFPTVFDWLKTHDVNAAVILVIMVVVAVFNMATALLTLVLERTRMIGLLKTMGMNSASLRRIFSLPGLDAHLARGRVGQCDRFGNLSVAILFPPDPARSRGLYAVGGARRVRRGVVVGAQCGSRGRDFNVADASGFDHFTGQTGGGDPLRFIKYIKDETIRYRAGQERTGARDVRPHRSGVRPVEPHAFVSDR